MWSSEVQLWTNDSYEPILVSESNVKCKKLFIFIKQYKDYDSTVTITHKDKIIIIQNKNIQEYTSDWPGLTKN